MKKWCMLVRLKNVLYEVFLSFSFDTAATLLDLPYTLSAVSGCIQINTSINTIWVKKRWKATMLLVRDWKVFQCW